MYGYWLRNACNNCNSPLTCNGLAALSKKPPPRAKLAHAHQSWRAGAFKALGGQKGTYVQCPL